jgi:hypothetical protein
MLTEDDQVMAQAVVSRLQDIEAVVEQALKQQALEMDAETHDGMSRLRLELGFMEKLRRIYVLAERIARAVLPPEVAGKMS